LQIIDAALPLGTAVLNAARTCVESGGTLVFPTDTVYGIGCDPENGAAVDAVYAAKKRPAEKPLAIHLAQPADARRYAMLSPAARAVIERLWPGPVAIVALREPGVCDAAARWGATISLRCPASDACAAILRATGALAATSANVSGRPAFTGAPDEFDRLPDATLAVITGPTFAGRESTVVDCTEDPIRILREGALSRQAIEAALRGSGVALRSSY